MARTVASLSVSINARTKGLRKGLQSAGKMVGKFRSDLADLGARFAKVGAAGAAALGGAVAVGIGKTIKSLSALAKASDNLNISPNVLTAIRDAASEVGIEAKTSDTALQRMFRRIQEAAKGKGEARFVLHELRLDAERLSKLKPEERVMKVAKAMAEAAGDGQTLARAMKLFDSEGVRMHLTLKNLNDKGLKHFLDGVKKTGRAVTREELVPSESIEDRLKRIGDRFAGLFVRLIKVIGKPLDDLLEKLERFFDSDDLLKDVEKAFQRIAEEIGKADQHLKSLKDNLSAGKKKVQGAVSDATSVTGAVGTMIGGMAAQGRENLSRLMSGNLNFDSSIFDQALEDATRQLGDIPKRIKDTAKELVDGAVKFGRELRDNTMKFVDDITGKNSGGFIQNNTTGKRTTVGNPDVVRGLEKVERAIRETGPMGVPPGTMLIKVHG